MEFNIKPKRYYIVTAIISFFSLILFLNNGIINVGNLITSSFIGLLPFVIDELVFLDDTISYKKDKVFKTLRLITRIGIILIAVVGVVWIFKSIGVLKFPDAYDSTYFIINPEGFLGRFDSSVIHEVLSIETILAYHIVIFITSVIIRFLNAHFYRLKLEMLKKVTDKSST